MAAAKILTPIEEPEKVKKIFSVMKDWGELELESSNCSILKPQRYTGNQDKLTLRFNGYTPATGEATLSFDVGGTVYHLKGYLKATELESEFKPVSFFTEQKRKVVRLNVPDSYYSQFSIRVISGEATQIYARIDDISTGGCRMKLPLKPELKIGAQFEGAITLGNHPEVKIAARARYVEKNENCQIIGVEFRHYEFGSEDKLKDVIEKLKREIA